MADNVYLLETRLSGPQQTALAAVRDVARQHAVTVFLVGGAVRDLISGSPVRDLDIAVQGNALDLRAALQQAGGAFSGEDKQLQAVYLRFPGGVRVEVGSTLAVTYPKPAQPVYQPTSILEDLRRRDFTANAMALSLNDGSYGLLMDPLNGVADIENRELRLVSNYGFIEDPVRLLRAARFMARLGWQMDERTRARYETAKEEVYIDALLPGSRAYELEELFHEEDPLRVMRRLEEEGWLRHISPALSVAKANTAELGRLRDVQMQFQTRGVLADVAAANFALLTAKLSTKEIEAIRTAFPRAGFVDEINELDSAAKDLSARLLSRELAAPSLAYQYLMQAPASVVVYAAFSSRSTALQNRLKSFLTEWPTAQTKIPYLLMQEMRITPDLPEYDDIVNKTMFAIMDGRLGTADETRAFLEPFSPPAPPPPVSLRRPRAPRKEAKGKGKKKVVALAAEESDLSAGDANSAAAQRNTPAAQAATPAETQREPAASSASTAKQAAKSTTPKPVPAKAAVVPAEPAAAKSASRPSAKAATPPAKQPAAKNAATPPKSPARAPQAAAKAKPEKGKPSQPPSRTAKPAPAAPAKKQAPAKQSPPPRKPATSARKPAPGKPAAPAKKIVQKSASRPPAKKAVAAKPARRPAKPVSPAKRAVPAKPPARAGKSAPARKRR